MIKLNKGYYFYPEYASITIHELNIKDPINNIIDEKVKELKKNILSWERSSLSIAPTGFCAGRCQYCYAKNYYNENDYLTPELLNTFIIQHNIKVDKKHSSAIVYGGEPVFNFKAYKKLITYLSNNFKYVCTVTSTFYPEKIFQQFLELYTYIPNFTVTISLDKYSKNYPRIYLNDGLDYLRTYERFKKLHAVDPYRVNIRSTIREEDGYFNWIKNIENEIGYFQHNCDYDTTYNGDANKLIKQLQNYLSYKKIQDPNYVYTTFYMLDSYPTLVGMMKSCDVNITRLAVNHKGQRIKCVDNLLDTNIPENIENYIFNTSHDICVGCNWKNICLSKCFYVFSKASCDWTKGITLEYLNYKIDKGEVQDLINKSILQLI